MSWPTGKIEELTEITTGDQIADCVEEIAKAAYLEVYKKGHNHAKINGDRVNLPKGSWDNSNLKRLLTESFTQARNKVIQ